MSVQKANCNAQQKVVTVFFMKEMIFMFTFLIAGPVRFDGSKGLKAFPSTRSTFKERFPFDEYLKSGE